MRVALGITRPTGPRAHLKAKANAEAERLAAAAFDAAMKDGSLALKLIREVDPPVAVELSARGELTPEIIKSLSSSELRALAGMVAEHQSAGLESSPQAEA
jgi:hypothetical protein